MTCKCGHLVNDHAAVLDKHERQECFKCDCLKFDDSTRIRAKVSEACEWGSCEFCLLDFLNPCQHECHKDGIKVPEAYQ